MSNASELEGTTPGPCPCCEGEPTSCFVTGMVCLWRVGCQCCGINVEVGCKPFDEVSKTAAKFEAERRWNRRPDLARQVTQLEAQLAEVREALARLVRARDDYLEAEPDTIAETAAASELDRAHEHARALLAQSKEPK